MTLIDIYRVVQLEIQCISGMTSPRCSLGHGVSLSVDSIADRLCATGKGVETGEELCEEPRKADGGARPTRVS